MAVVYALVTPRKVVLHLVLQMLISVGSFLFVAGQLTLSSGATSPEDGQQAEVPGRPCLEKYRRLETHTACLPRSDKSTPIELSTEDKELIIATHNKYRSSVSPTATNMLKMSWDDEIAMIAQAWAETCSLEHDESQNRDIPGRLSLGQNLGDGFRDWSGVIDAWYVEVKDFTFRGDDNVLEEVGHYTQGVWADSNKLGCGASHCGNIIFYVCNYGPAGNVDPWNTPYKTGQPCSTCPTTCLNNLCSCGDLVCENGGTMDRASCQCHCHHSWLVERQCKLNCSAIREPYYCGAVPYDREGCDLYENVPHDCPTTCEICPYSDYVEGAFTTTTTTTTTTAPTSTPTTTAETTQNSSTTTEYISSPSETTVHAAPTNTTDMTSSTTPVRPTSGSGSGHHACGDKFAAASGGTHSACLPRSPEFLRGGVSQSDRQVIVNEHNRYRSSVVPSAGNMMALSWDPEVSMVAQGWAETCSMTGDNPAMRTVPGTWGTLGQNMAVNSSSWEDAILSWYREKDHFTFGSRELNASSERYAQLAWASTVRVGCGFADCGTHTVYVCDYAPRMNVFDLENIYKAGEPCQQCPDNCVRNLCDCGERSCQNLGSLDPATCTCECLLPSHRPPSCTVACGAVEEESFCRTSSSVTCSSIDNMAVYCPLLCDVCPYGEDGYIEGSVPLPNARTSVGTSGCVATSALAAGLHVFLLFLAVIFCVN